MKKITISKILPYITSSICLIGLILYPPKIAEGVKNGIILLCENIIPSIFPFMVLSTYIANSSLVHQMSNYLQKITKSVFGVSGKGFLAVILGLLGGYPVGAKIITEYYENKIIDKSEAHRLICWCVNPGFAFVVTAVGKFMLGSTNAGIIMYCSVVLSSFTIGFLIRLTQKPIKALPPQKDIQNIIDKENLFIHSVSSGSNAMLSICGWVLTFSAIGAGIEALFQSSSATVFLKSVLEVTTGCKNGAAYGLSLPLICAVLSFGGFAVIFQIAPYLKKINFSLKLFIALRIINGALSAFYCSLIVKLFPRATEVYAVIAIGENSIALSHSVLAAVFLILTCFVLILEVDYRKKVC